MRLARALISVFILGLLAACITASNSESTRFSASPPKPGFGVAYVGRPGGWNTSFVPLEIELDGRPLVTLGFNDYTRVELRPGRYSIGAPDTYRTRVTAGIPHAVELTVEAGKAYYLLPKLWAENERTAIVAVGTTFVPTRTADGHTSFSIQTSRVTDAPPSSFLELSYVAPAGS